MDQVMRINVRGSQFLSSSSSVKDMIHSMEEKGHAIVTQSGEYFVDRNPIFFNVVLDYYTSGKIHLPKNICPIQAREEVIFWQIPKCNIPMCCYRTLYDDDLSDYQTVRDLDITYPKATSTCSTDVNIKPSRLLRIRMDLLEALNHPFQSYLGKIWLLFTVIVTLTSIIVYMMNSLVEFRESRPELLNEIPENMTLSKLIAFLYSSSNPKEILWITTRTTTLFQVLDLTTNTILLFDLIIRFTLDYNKKKFFLEIKNIAECLAIIAVYFFVFLDTNLYEIYNEQIRVFLMFMGIMYSLRVVRILRVAETSPEMKILKFSLQKSWREFLLVIIAFISFSLIFGSVMYWIEFEQSETFSDIFISIWWAVVTMTTVGYGDQVPKTPTGYVVGSFASLMGLLILALPIALLASNFSNLYDCYKFWKLHKEFKDKPASNNNSDYVSLRKDKI